MVKQKLPGVYVQPSYQSALSKLKAESFDFSHGALKKKFLGGWPKSPLIITSSGFGFSSFFSFSSTSLPLHLWKNTPAWVVGAFQHTIMACAARGIVVTSMSCIYFCVLKKNFSHFALIYVCTCSSSSSFTVWFGVIFIRHGLYHNGVFKFTVYIPDNYPDGDCPVSHSHLKLVEFLCANFHV